MGSEQSAIALLLFRVGPVLCCAPANPVQTIISPPKLTHPPGSNNARPGIFYHADHVVSVSELRHRFGVAETDREQPGRLIITQQDDDFIAYWVDEIIEVIDTPTEGWSKPSSYLPQGVFSKTLLLNEKIYLFADFINFKNMPDSGYLSQYIDKLSSGMSTIDAMAEPVEDTRTEQTSTTTPSEANASATTEEIIAPQSTIPDTEKKDDQHDNTIKDKDKNKETNTPVSTQQPQNTTEHDDPAPRLESIPQHTEIAVEHDATPEDTQQAPPTTLANEAEAITAEPVSQTESEVNIIRTDTESVSTTLNADTTSAEPQVSETIENIALEGNEEEINKTTEFKPVVLNPVPGIVPESEQETEKPAFQWHNLAAAVVLLITAAGIGVYYSLSSSNKSVSRQTKSHQPTITPSINVVHNETAAPHKDDDVTETDSEPVTESVMPAKLETKKYHAKIKPDHQGVTIILHSPPDEPAFKPVPTASTNATTIQKKIVSTPEKSINKRTTGQQEITHIVIKGDTLWAIAKRYVNNPYKYSRLAKLSKIKNPDKIYPGNRVHILRYIPNAE